MGYNTVIRLIQKSAERSAVNHLPCHCIGREASMDLMTEEQWWDDKGVPETLIFRCIRDKVTRKVASVRKLRLFACTCCRRVWRWLT